MPLARCLSIYTIPILVKRCCNERLRSHVAQLTGMANANSVNLSTSNYNTSLEILFYFAVFFFENFINIVF